MSHFPLVSIILTTYNREQWVIRSLKSVAAQTHRPLQVVIVDNNSSDSSLILVQDWIARQIPSWGLDFLFLRQPNSGVCAARNLGWKVAQGEWIAFFDDDDEMTPYFVEQMLNATSDLSTTNWILARTKMYFSNKKVRTRVGWRGAGITEHLLGNIVSTQSFLVRKKMLQHIGGWNETLPCWNDFALGAALFCYDPHPTWCNGVFHRIYQHKNSITGDSLTQKINEIKLSLLSVHNTLNQYFPRLHPAHFALELRCTILRALLKRERGFVHATNLKNAPYETITQTKWLFKFLNNLLFYYTRYLRIGAWRIALWIVYCYRLLHHLETKCKDQSK